MTFLCFLYFIFLFFFLSIFFCESSPYGANLFSFRRFTWSLLRVEKEHLLNCEAFRAIEFISLPVDLNEVLSFTSFC